MTKYVSKRTQMYFPIEIFNELKLLSKKEHKSIAGIIREVAIDFLKKKRKIASWKNDPLANIVGKGKSRDTDLSIYHDKYLYGAK